MMVLDRRLLGVEYLGLVLLRENYIVEAEEETG